MEDTFILPENERELFDRYFDNDKYGGLKERLELVKKALHNALPPAERNKHLLNVDARELLGEKSH